MIECPAGWKKFENSRPYTSVIGLVVGPDGKFLVQHRSNGVRSAKNAWSLPSGLHEVGFTMQEQFCIEVQEELGLTVVPESVEFVDCFEAILPDDGWHWVLHLFMAYSPDVNFTNKEPDKHDIIDRLTFDEVMKLDPWTKGLQEGLAKNQILIKAGGPLLVSAYGKKPATP